ncbi:MAG: hypothetical protein M1821_006779 [Bathelium mastoideum]|nr:MAG: hypothetical protein M1821_006779 [Bathelium mastoideum]
MKTSKPKLKSISNVSAAFFDATAVTDSIDAVSPTVVSGGSAAAFDVANGAEASSAAVLKGSVAAFDTANVAEAHDAAISNGSVAVFDAADIATAGNADFSVAFCADVTVFLV